MRKVQEEEGGRAVKLTQVIFLSFLIWGAWWDMKAGAFPTAGLAVFGAVGLAAALMERSKSLWDMAGGAAVGAVLLGISFLKPEQIGDGDGIFLLVTGILLGFWGNVALLFYSLLPMALLGVLYAAAGRPLRALRVPFAPFALAAGLGMMIL